jgi:hypothetical protein
MEEKFVCVGNRSMYESGDQRNVPVSELKERARYAEGMPTRPAPDTDILCRCRVKWGLGGLEWYGREVCLNGRG